MLQTQSSNPHVHTPLLIYSPRQAENMSTVCDPRLIEDAEAYWTFLAVFNGLRKDVLQAVFLLKSDLNRSGGPLCGLVIAAQLLKVVGRKEAGMQCQLAHTSQQAEHVRLDLWMTLVMPRSSYMESLTAAALIDPCCCKRFPTRSCDSFSTAS